MPRSKTEPTTDVIDVLIEHWLEEHPGLDLSSTQVIGRILRLNYYAARMEETALASFELHLGEFDLLAALRRSPPPHQLPPNLLQNSLLVSSGALTNRIDRLERAGLVKRIPDTVDRRSVQIKLTPSGRRRVDEAIGHILDVERGLLSPLTQSETRVLAGLLKRMLLPLEKRRRPRKPVAAADGSDTTSRKGTRK